MKPQLIIMVGPTGCGKTTYRKRVFPAGPVISPDDFIIGPWTGKKAGLAWEHAAKMAGELFKEGKCFLIDAQFVNPYTRWEWQQKAQVNGYESHAVIFNTPWEQIQANQKARGSRGNYGEIPLDVQKAKYEEFRIQFEDKSIFQGFDGFTIEEWKEERDIGL